MLARCRVDCRVEDFAALPCLVIGNGFRRLTCTHRRACRRNTTFFKLEIEDRPADHERRRDQFGLRGMQPENMVLGIDPDLLDKEPFDPIDN